MEKAEDSQTIFQAAIVENELLASSLAATTDKIYIPTELRTDFLIVFCIVTIVVTILLLIASAAYLGAHGLESLAVYPTEAKRAVLPQTSDAVVPLETFPPSTAPNPANYTNPNSL